MQKCDYFSLPTEYMQGEGQDYPTWAYNISFGMV